MKIYLTTAYPYNVIDNFAAQWLKESAASDPFGKHQLCCTPSQADLILFVEHHPPHDPYFFEVKRHPLYRNYKDKVLLYHDHDYVVPLISGIFPSVRKTQYDARLMQPAPYVARLCNNDAVSYVEEKPAAVYLYSFIGAARTHAVRYKIMELKGKAFLKDTSEKNLWQLTGEEKREFEKQYTEVSLKSRFVLCPRGLSPNSYRLYETMEMGISPVIISDEWVPMEGPEWESFSVRVAEKHVQHIPDILKEREAEAALMGKKARKAWEEWFSKEVCFHHICEACEKLHKSSYHRKALSQLKAYAYFLKPFHAKNLLRQIIYSS